MVVYANVYLSCICIYISVVSETRNSGSKINIYEVMEAEIIYIFLFT